MNSFKLFKRNPQACAGLFFAAVFVEGLFPLPGVALLFAAPCLVLLARERPDSISMNFAVLPLLAISLYYWLIIPHFSDQIGVSLIKQILYFYLMVLLFSFSKIEAAPQDFLHGFWMCLIPFALMASLIGVCKVVLQEQGYVLAGLIDIYDTFAISYPYGSSLRTDYNIYSLSLLIALVGVIPAFLKAEGRRRWGSALQMALLLLAIYLSGSRRAYGLLILVLLWGGCVAAFCHKRSGFLRYSAVLIGLVLFTVLFSGSILTGKAYDGYQRFPGELLQRLEHKREFGAEANKPVVGSAKSVPEPASDNGLEQAAPAYQGQVITYTPGQLASTVMQDESLGLASRIDRWAFAIDLLRTKGWLLGQGFSYRAAFSCQFVACAYADYPHNIFLSEFLLAGVVGLSLSLVAAFSLVFLALKSQAVFWSSGAGMVMMVALPTLLISGDGVFSISQVVASYFFAFLFLQNKYVMIFPLTRSIRGLEK